MGRMMAHLTVSRRFLSNPNSNTVSRILLSKPKFRNNLLSSARSLFTSSSFPPSSSSLSRGLPSSPVSFNAVARFCQVSNLDQLGYVPERWWVVMDKPEGDLSRDQIIHFYINMLARVTGCSEEEARMKICSVSTRYYYGFGAVVDYDLLSKCMELPGVRHIYYDLYVDQEKKMYRGEPFINGEALPYDPKYHEKWEYHAPRVYDEEEDEEEEEESEVEEEGYDKEHWLVFMKRHKFKGLSKDEIIDSYIKILADHLFNGSVEEARMRIYMVSTRFYYAFGVHLDKECNQMLDDLPGVDYILADSYLDPKYQREGTMEEEVDAEYVLE